MAMGYQQNNYSPMGQGQPRKPKKRDWGQENFGGQVQQPIMESVAPGIPPAAMGGALKQPSSMATGNMPVNSTMPIGGQPKVSPVDPRAYVQSLLPQGMATPQALAGIEPQLNAQGINLQRNSAGDVRGRLYLPNPGGYQYGNAVDVVSQWNQPWSWSEHTESAPPRKAPGNEVYNKFQQMLMPQQQDNSNELEELLQILMAQNQESI